MQIVAFSARPNESWGRYADYGLNLCGDCDNQHDDDASDDEASASPCNQKESENVLAFKTIFNGDWRCWKPQDLRHYCVMGCKCGCKTEHELKTKAVLLYCTVVLGTRPKVPCLSRWVRCSMTTGWFLRAFLVHGIYLHATKALYNMQPNKSKNPIHQDLGALVADFAAEGEAWILPEMPECKIMRVRSKKAVEWVLSPEAPVDLAWSLTVTAPIDHFSIWLFAQQHEASSNL